jgi:hypothetical protein
MTQFMLFVWPIATISCLVFAISGCGLREAASFRPEQRIITAFPVSESVGTAKAAALEFANEGRRKKIEEQFDARLRSRALSCAKEYAPAWYTPSSQIRKKLDERCFAAADEEIARWLGILRAGLLLARPPLTPVPWRAPSTIIASGPIDFARFADNAAVTLVQTQDAIEVIDFGAGKILFQEVRGSAVLGYPSPNGRLFTFVEENNLQVRESETGRIAAEFSPTRAHLFHWLDYRTAVYSTRDFTQNFLVDFSSGAEIAIPLLKGHVLFRAIHAPGSENEYILFSSRGVTKIELVRRESEPGVKLVDESMISGHIWAFNTSGPTTEGIRYFSVVPDLALVALDSLQIDRTSFAPFHIQSGLPTPDPDKLVITGFLKPDATKDFVYSISTRMLMPINRAKVNLQRLSYVASLRRFAVIASARIDLVEVIPTLEPISLSRFLSEARLAAPAVK